MQLGPGYAAAGGIDNDYIYVYLGDNRQLQTDQWNTLHRNRTIWMARTKWKGTGGGLGNIHTRVYEIFRGLVAGVPTWGDPGDYTSGKTPVFRDNNGMGLFFNVAWHPAINKFVATYIHSRSPEDATTKPILHQGIAVAIADTPWDQNGWTMIGYNQLLVNDATDEEDNYMSVMAPSTWNNGSDLRIAVSTYVIPGGGSGDNLIVTSAALTPARHLPASCSWSRWRSTNQNEPVTSSAPAIPACRRSTPPSTGIMSGLIQTLACQIRKECGRSRPTPAPYAPPNDDLNNANPLCANPVAAAANKIYDFRDQVAVQHDLRTIPAPFHGYQYSVWESTAAGANSVICGGKVHTLNDDWLSDPWAEVHGKDRTGFNAPGIWITANGTGARWQGFYLKNTQDGFQPRAENWVLENFCIRFCRDDVIENDDQYSGTIRNAYLQGHVLLSVRPEVGSRTEDNLHCIVTFEYCVIRMMRQPNDGDEKAHNGSDGADYGGQQSRMRNPYSNPTDPNRHDTVPSSQVNSVDWFAHKGCFKSHVKNTTQHLYEARVHMRNCIILYETEPVEGPGGAYFPGTGDNSITPGGSHTGSRYENVTLSSLLRVGGTPSVTCRLRQS